MTGRKRVNIIVDDMGFSESNSMVIFKIWHDSQL